MSDSNSLWTRWLKFNLVGVIGICAQLGVLGLLTSTLGFNYLLATAVAVEAAIIHNFFWHERFTWSERRTRTCAGRLLKFYLTTGLFSLAGNVGFTKLFVDAGASYLIANGSAIALCSIINFLLNDLVVFIAPQEHSSIQAK
jgi:dolichol-phosphate mannosyltransferase